MPENLTKSRDLKYRLQARFAANGLRPHDRIPSQRELSTEFGINLKTVRKALDELENDGVVYHKERVGSFIAPPVRKNQILLVGPPDPDRFLLLFYRGMNAKILEVSLEFIPLILDFRNFEAALPDLEILYRDLAAVVFFRNVERFLGSAPVLRKAGIPSFFYGSDRLEERPPGTGVLLHSERETSLLAAGFIADRRRSAPVGILFHSGHPTSLRRVEHFRREALKLGLAVDEGLVFASKEFNPFVGDSSASAEEWLDRVTTARATVLCTVDALAALLVQTAMRRSVRIPEDLSVVGIDNSEFSKFLFPSLTTVEVPVEEDGGRCVELLPRLLSGEKIDERSRVRMIVRESA